MRLELGSTGRYGLRAVIYLARKGGRTTAGEIAEATEVPRRQLARVMAQLSGAGLVESYEGHGGGATLARPAEEITVRSVVEATEGPFEVRHCIMYQRLCGTGVPCVMHEAWIEGQEAILQHLESQSIAEFISDTVERVEQKADTATLLQPTEDKKRSER